MRSLLLLTAAVIAVIAGIAALQWSNRKMAVAPSTPAPDVSSSSTLGVEAVDVLVARGDIAIGAMITEDMIDKQPWPQQLVLDGFITGDIAASGVVGKIARAPIQAREPLVLSRLADANQPGFLAAALGDGMRAMTLATDAVTGIAGYVFPGDRVDILFVHNLSGQGAMPSVSEVIAPNVRVLALNVREETAAGAMASMVTGAAGAPSSITVEVSEEMAQKLRLAEKVGGLSLALRSIHDRDKDDVPLPSHLGGLSRNHTGGGDAVSAQPVRIIRGVGPENEPKPAAVSAASPGGNPLSGLLGALGR